MQFNADKETFAKDEQANAMLTKALQMPPSERNLDGFIEQMAR